VLVVGAMVVATEVGNIILATAPGRSAARWPKWLESRHGLPACLNRRPSTRYVKFSDEDIGGDDGDRDGDGDHGNGSCNRDAPDEEEGGVAGGLIPVATAAHVIRLHPRDPRLPHEESLASVAEEEEEVQRRFSDREGKIDDIERTGYSTFSEEHLPLWVVETEEILADNPKIGRRGAHELRAGGAVQVE
jgi:hypothetical protein